MNEPVTVTYSLEEVFKRIEDKIDNNQKEIKQEIKDINTKLDKLNGIEVKIATLTEKVEGMDKRLEKVEGTQKNQVWALIILLAGAIATAGARLFFTTNP
ncbi:hypothetical protein [Crocosphaera chwakensis]|uniref:Fzo/mitofusin HR2 domain-containing protein n=1 Tax=Crocosphaera chwakensis CCY0110 TaxID=391612 RepID=A3IZ35_9CHRO|nr:hypothetical protein [Crocosphaera chwakensis]EAZ88274.1 hypothetical protein CY0110_06654 [Crocosphaera chwakensis CCY0110]